MKIFGVYVYRIPGSIVLFFKNSVWRIGWWMLLTTGCVSLGYHQREVDEARRTENQFALKLAEQVRAGEISARDQILILEGRR